MSKTYRGAYLDHGDCNITILTTPEQSTDIDAVLIHEALAKALCTGILDLAATDTTDAAPKLTYAQFEAQLRIGELPL